MLLLLPKEFEDLSVSGDRLTPMDGSLSEDNSDFSQSESTHSSSTIAAGAPSEDASISTKGRVNLSALATHKQPTEPLTEEGIPGKWDVLCGRGRGFYEHLGNRRFLSILEPYKIEYQTATKAQKSSIARQVADLILEPHEEVSQDESGRVQVHTIRFWRKAHCDSSRNKQSSKRKKQKSSKNPATEWIELDETEVLKKVAHTLRETKSIVRSSKRSTRSSGKNSPVTSPQTSPSIRATASEDHDMNSVPFQLSFDDDQKPKAVDFPSRTHEDSDAGSVPQQHPLPEQFYSPMPLYASSRAAHAGIRHDSQASDSLFHSFPLSSPRASQDSFFSSEDFHGDNSTPSWSNHVHRAVAEPLIHPGESIRTSSREVAMLLRQPLYSLSGEDDWDIEEADADNNEPRNKEQDDAFDDNDDSCHRTLHRPRFNW